jgi:hypothetical protein
MARKTSPRRSRGNERKAEGGLDLITVDDEELAARRQAVAKNVVKPKVRKKGGR